MFLSALLGFSDVNPSCSYHLPSMLRSGRRLVAEIGGQRFLDEHRDFLFSEIGGLFYFIGETSDRSTRLQTKELMENVRHSVGDSIVAE